MHYYQKRARDSVFLSRSSVFFFFLSRSKRAYIFLKAKGERAWRWFGREKVARIRDRNSFIANPEQVSSFERFVYSSDSHLWEAARLTHSVTSARRPAQDIPRKDQRERRKMTLFPSLNRNRLEISTNKPIQTPHNVCSSYTFRAFWYRSTNTRVNLLDQALTMGTSGTTKGHKVSRVYIRETVCSGCMENTTAYGICSNLGGPRAINMPRTLADIMRTAWVDPPCFLIYLYEIYSCISSAPRKIYTQYVFVRRDVRIKSWRTKWRNPHCIFVLKLNCHDLLIVRSSCEYLEADRSTTFSLNPSSRSAAAWFTPSKT